MTLPWLIPTLFLVYAFGILTMAVLFMARDDSEHKASRRDNSRE
jgi:hypothetical protein